MRIVEVSDIKHKTPQTLINQGFPESLNCVRFSHTFFARFFVNPL